MSAAATADAATDAGEKSNKKLIIIVGAAVVVVVIAAVVVVLTLLGGGNKEAKPDPAKEYGAVVSMENEMTLNLSDGAFLRAKLSLQLSEKATEDLGGEEAVKKFDSSKARDAAILILSKRTKDDLLKPANREQAQAELSQEVSKRYNGQVLKVYFTEFVMQ